MTVLKKIPTSRYFSRNTSFALLTNREGFVFLHEYFRYHVNPPATESDEKGTGCESRTDPLL